MSGGGGCFPEWIPLARELPLERQVVMLTGPSGTGLTPNFLTLGYYDENFRPSHGGATRWLDIHNDALTDQGWVPTHWAPAPTFPPKPGSILLPGDD